MCLCRVERMHAALLISVSCNYACLPACMHPTRPSSCLQTVGLANESGNTALHWSCLMGHEAVTRLLMEAGANASALNKCAQPVLLPGAVHAHVLHRVRLLAQCCRGVSSGLMQRPARRREPLQGANLPAPSCFPRHSFSAHLLTQHPLGPLPRCPAAPLPRCPAAPLPRCLLQDGADAC